MINFFKKYKIFTLFVAVFAVHAIFVFTMDVAHLQPLFSGGDDIMYNHSAVEISQEFRQGNFSLELIRALHPDVYLLHFYPTLIAIFYTIFLPNIIVGQFINALFCALTSVFVYLIVLELGGSKVGAFAAGLAISLYPSLVLNSVLLLKEAVAVCLSVAILYLAIRFIKKFNVVIFVLMYLLFLLVTNLRFYLGYALMISFMFCWFLLSKDLKFKNRFLYAVVMIFFLGFVPLLNNQGYWGVNFVQEYTNIKKITFYREVAYRPVSTISHTGAGRLPVTGSEATLNAKMDFRKPLSAIISYLISFIYVLLGPLPWQIKSLREVLALFETIPWYFVIYFVVKGIMVKIKKRDFAFFPLIFFAVLYLAVLALFQINFGNFMRTRIPAFVSLICIAPLAFNLEKIYSYFKKTIISWLNISSPEVPVL